jgi:hypothetical protein
MKPVEKNLKRNNSGKKDLKRRISGEKISKEINPDEKAAGGVFR